MDKPWPPVAPDVRMHFENAHEARQSEPAKTEQRETVTKGQIEALEKQRKPTTAQMHFTPPGIKPRTTNIAHLERIEEMKQRLQQGTAKAREDFGRSAGRDL